MDVGNLMGTASALGQIGAALSPWVPTRGPVSADAVGADFITAHVGSGVPGARCIALHTVGGTTGTTDRRRVALDWNQAGRDAGLPESVFIKSTPLSAKNRAMVAPLGMATNEVRFYRSIRSDVGALAPRSWYAWSGHGARFLIVQEDLLGRGARPYELKDSCPTEHAFALAEAHAQLHASLWQSPRLEADLTWVRPWSRRTGYAVLKTFYRRGRMAWRGKYGPEEPAATNHVADMLDRYDETVWAAMEEGPLTVLHGDPHLGNTYSLPDGGAGLLDWQVIWRGPGLRDITYFAVTALDADQRREAFPELLRHYLTCLAKYGVTDVPDYDTAFDRVRLFAAEALDAGFMTRAWPGLQATEGLKASTQRAQSLPQEWAVGDAVREAALNR